MATLTNKNEKVVAPFFKNGVTLQFFTITFDSDVSAKLDTDTVSYSGAAVRSPVAVALEAIAQVATIEVIGTVSTTALRIGVAAIGGAYGTDTYDGTNSETFAAHLEDLVQAATDCQGVDMSATTVVAFAL
jgi:hypothetical protein